MQSLIEKLKEISPIFFTQHFDQRKLERHPETKKENIFRMINDANEELKNGGDKKEYLIFSKSLNFGVVVAYNKGRVVVITLLPSGHEHAKKGTIKIYVESFYQNEFSDNFLEFLEALEHTLIEGVADDYYEKDIFVDDMRLTAIYIDNKFLEFKQCGIIEVE